LRIRVYYILREKPNIYTMSNVHIPSKGHHSAEGHKEEHEGFVQKTKELAIRFHAAIKEFFKGANENEKKTDTVYRDGEIESSEKISLNNIPDEALLADTKRRSELMKKHNENMKRFYK